MKLKSYHRFSIENIRLETEVSKKLGGGTSHIKGHFYIERLRFEIEISKNLGNMHEGGTSQVTGHLFGKAGRAERS